MDKNETEQQILAEINKSKSFFQQHKKICVTGLLLMVLFALAFISYRIGQKSASESIPGVTTVYSAPDAELTPYTVLDAAQANNRQVSTRDANDIARLANRSASNEKAYAHSITTDEAVADNQAKEIAKDSKADMVIKQTSEDTKASNDKIQVSDNNYYVIQQTRKHSVSVGAADINNEAYATISYRNRDITYTGYYNPSTKDAGVGVSIQIASW